MQENLNKLYNNEITQLFFLTETVGYYFMNIKQKIYDINKEVVKINRVLNNIINYINKSKYYYIPQIFLQHL